MCGTPAQAPAASPAGQAAQDPASASSSKLPWLVAAGAVIALLAVVLIPRLQEDEPRVAAAPAGAATGGPVSGPAGDARSVDLASMTPREAADRLFNRVMQNVSSGDTAQARQFLPMALMAYERVEDLDLDGRYHVAELQLLNGDAQAARAQADTILNEVPNHLYGLFAAARAEQMLGNDAAARDLYDRFLEHYDAEVATSRPEYEGHSQMLPLMREEARSAANGA